MKRTALTSLLLFLLLSGCRTLAPPPPGPAPLSLPEVVEGIIGQAPLDQAHWGILILDPAAGEVLYSRNAHRKFVPASNMKIPPTATALSLLGPDHRYRTELWALGPVDAPTGTLRGDLVLSASGDPTLSDRFHPTATAPLDSLADSLLAAGIRRVEGALVLDLSAWDSTTVPGSWMVANLPSRSAATGGAFSIGEGEFVVEVRGGVEAARPGDVRWWPVGEEDFLQAAFRTAPPDSALRVGAHYLPETRRIRLEGQVPAGRVDTTRVAQRDPVGQGAAALLRALERRGIGVQGGIRLVWDPGKPLGEAGCRSGELAGCPGGRPVAALLSPPLTEIVKAILEPSQNRMAEQLVRTLGAERGERGSWQEGFRVQEEFLVGTVGVDSLDLAFRDGSGLSAYNLVTPRALVRILDHMRQSPHGEIYRDAMAEPGEEGSTLSSRLPGLRGRVFAKTGTITHVNSLSGYLVTDSGRELVFSILTNGSGIASGPVRGGIDRIVEAAARR